MDFTLLPKFETDSTILHPKINMDFTLLPRFETDSPVLHPRAKKQNKLYVTNKSSQACLMYKKKTHDGLNIGPNTSFIGWVVFIGI